jgi:hydroxymethylpyrimidine pyrophosphatase-like HAD family hydrolase
MTFPKLFVTDLDGTALGGGYQPYARFPDSYSEFLDRLAAGGCHWAINTTWDVAGQWQLVLASAVRSRPLFLMGETGHSLAQIAADGPVPVEPYSATTRAAAFAVNEKHLFPLMRDVCRRFTPARMHFYGHLFLFVAAPTQTAAFDAYIAHACAGTTTLTWRCRDGSLVAYPALLDKGRSLAEVVRLTGLTPAEVVVAGDEIADVNMMRSDLAENAVCPDNAGAAVKAHVLGMDGVVGNVAHGAGVIAAFARLAAKRGWDFR